MKRSKDNEPGEGFMSGEEQEPTTEEQKRDEGVLYIGIDLGTSRTSVAASNGVRETVWSYVGYPKDHVARKVLGKDKLFGREAVEQRLSLDLIRPFAEGIIKHDGQVDQATLDKHLQAAKDLVRHAVSMVRPRKDELIYGVIGAPAQASIENQQLLLEAASEVLDAAMICSEPFAVAYGLDLLRDTLVVDIGAGTVDLCRLHGTMPAPDDQITLGTAGDWLDKQLFSLIKEAAPDADYTIHFVKEAKEKFAYVLDEGNAIEVELLVSGKPTTYDITSTMREGCRMIVPPIVESLHKLISTFDPDFQRKLRENVLLAGGGSQIHGLDRVLEQAMHDMLGSGKVIRVEEAQYAGANGALKMAHDTPEDYWKRLE